MTEAVLNGCRVMIAEDEYFLASDTARLLAKAGATIIGPFGTLDQVQEQVRHDGFDVALLDIRLDRELVYPAADLLQRAGVPIAFLTGYDKDSVPSRFAAVPLCQKPCPDGSLVAMVSKLWAAR